MRYLIDTQFNMMAGFPDVIDDMTIEPVSQQQFE